MQRKIAIRPARHRPPRRSRRTRRRRWPNLFLACALSLPAAVLVWLATDPTSQGGLSGMRLDRLARLLGDALGILGRGLAAVWAATAQVGSQVLDRGPWPPATTVLMACLICVLGAWLVQRRV